MWGELDSQAHGGIGKCFGSPSLQLMFKHFFQLPGDGRSVLEAAMTQKAAKVLAICFTVRRSLSYLDAMQPR